MIDRFFVCFIGIVMVAIGINMEKKNPGDKKRCGYKGNSY